MDREVVAGTTGGHATLPTATGCYRIHPQPRRDPPRSEGITMLFIITFFSSVDIMILLVVPTPSLYGVS